MTRLILMCLIWTTGYFSILVNTASLNDTDTLYRDMMVVSKYNKRTRPVLDQEMPVNINLSFSLINIQNFDELSGEMSLVGIIHAVWFDTRITWDPASYNNTNTLMIPQDEVWKPHLVLVNPFDSIDVLGQDFFDIRFHFDGIALWDAGDVIRATCSVDISLYPYDIQVCSLKFLSWGYSDKEMLLRTPSEKFNLAYYTPNGEWELLDTSTTSVTMTSISITEMKIKMKRRSDYYIVNIILPIVFLFFLNVFVFVLPAKSGERVSYAITVLLALAVFLTLVSDHMPKSSRPMSHLSYFLMLSLVASTLICLLTILLLRLHHKDNSIPIPHWICRLTLLLISYRCCKAKIEQSTRKRIGMKNHHQKSEETEWREEPANDYDLTWKDVGGALDMFFFVFFIICAVLLVACFLASLSLMSTANQGPL